MESVILPDLGTIRREIIGSELIYKKALKIIQNEMCVFVSREDQIFNYVVEDRFDNFKVQVILKDHTFNHKCECDSLNDCCSHVAASMILLEQELREKNSKKRENERYTRDEMIQRILGERKLKANSEKFKIIFSENIYDSHQVVTATNNIYHVAFRDVADKNGYCTCPDYKTNKLGTCKHLIYASGQLDKMLKKSKKKACQNYPFVEIYCDPLNEYHISYFAENIEPNLKPILKKYFGEKKYILPEQYSKFLPFFDETENFKKVLIRPEVQEKIDRYFEDQQFKNLEESIVPDFSVIKGKLLGYQKQGILFSLFKRGNIIADEMGLGKTIQAISIAVLKKEIYNIRKVLVICPASLKYQWKQEIERFSSESAIVVEGPREIRHEYYKKSKSFFMIANYEAIMRDITIIRENPPDMIILDEAQRIKNYNTKTSYAVKSIPKKHSLVITGTPIENKLIDLYSIMNFIDPEILAPLWEFSMNHCYFDKSKKNEITGYYNLKGLKERLKDYVVRREKYEVMSELPEIQELNIPVELSIEQKEIHAGLSRSLASLMHKKHKTFYDMRRIFQLLTCMRMVCDSTYLIDKETNISPKLKELEEILIDKLNLRNSRRKILIFSEWKTSLHLIENMLNNKKIGFIRYSGDVLPKNRGKLIDEFNANEQIKVMLATGAGEAGLNLQAADTVINFELPWNPARKNQRIGRIHRIGQKSQKLMVINLISRESIEEKIASGIQLKESLFEAVLNENDINNEVDFSKKGRATMIEQIEKLVEPFSVEESSIEDIPKDSVKKQVEDMKESARIEEKMKDYEETEDIIIEQVEKQTTLVEEKEKPEKEISSQDKEKPAPATDTAILESTLNQGLQFLSGLLKMSSGKDLVTTEQSIKVDQETGEVTMKFKLPGF